MDEKAVVPAKALDQYRRKVEEDFPPVLDLVARAEEGGDALWTTTFIKALRMRYGENPGYPAAFYQEKGAVGGVSAFEVLQEGTKGLGYINVADMDIGQRLLRVLWENFSHQPICVVVKHEMPSGVARADTDLEALTDAWASDPLANFGGVVVHSGTINEPMADFLKDGSKNVEVVYAPHFTEQALRILADRKPLRVVRMSDINIAPRDNGIEFKRVAGGLLVQTRFKSKIVGPGFFDFESVGERYPTEYEQRAAAFLWPPTYYTRSNAVLIGSDHQTHGIGSGQRARIYAAEDAVRFAIKNGLGTKWCVMASDAFMPFPDVVELAAISGITAIIYPLGSVKDDAVIAKANLYNIAMLATRKPGTVDCERCFLHR